MQFHSQPPSQAKAYHSDERATTQSRPYLRCQQIAKRSSTVEVDNQVEKLEREEIQTARSAERLKVQSKCLILEG